MENAPAVRAAGCQRRHRSSRGQSLVEFAVILPVFILVVGGTVDLGRLFFAYVSTESAAKEGAMYGATSPQCDRPRGACPDPNNVRWHVMNELTNVRDVSERVECLRGVAVVPVVQCQEGDTYRVTVTHTFGLLTPILSPVLGSRIELTSRASALVINSAPRAND